MAIKRIDYVINSLGFRSRTSVYKNIRRGLLTRPIHISARAVGWLDTEVDAICAARIAGMPDDKIRELVTELHVRRKSYLKAPFEGAK
jgi:prophage regulatory protein